MKPSYAFGKPSKEMQEEFRLLEEMMNNQSKYNSLRYKQILMDLKSGDEIKILDAVTQLSNELSMAQEDSLAGVQLDFLIPELIKCLDKDGIPDIMLYAGICITQILDIIPQCANILVNCGGVDVLCQKMQNFEYIDVAENAIRALEKISEDYGGAILGTGGLDLMINMIDFFVVSIQKSILSIVSNTFRMVPNEQALTDQILPAIPALMNYLAHDPSKQETLVTMFSRLTDRVVRLCQDDFEKKKKYLEAVAGDKLMENLCFILSDNIENFNSNKLAQTENIIRTLNRICYYSSKLCVEAFNMGLISTIDRIFILLDSFTRKEGQFSILAYEMISLINSILALRATPAPLIGKIAAFIGIKILENARVNERLDMFKNNKHIMTGLVEKAATKLPSIYDSNQTPLHKYIVLICLEKLLSYSDEEDLKRSLDPSSLSLFLSKLTESNDIMIVALTLQIVELVFQKLPHAFNHLAREGLFEFISKMADPENIKKLEAVFVANKKLPGQYFNQGFGQTFSSFNPGYNQGGFNQGFPPVFSSKPNLPPQYTSNLGDADQKFDSFLSYVQGLNQKIGGTTTAQPSTNKFSTDPSNALSSLKAEKEKLTTYISEAKKILESKHLGEDSGISEENPDVQLKALEAKILKSELAEFKNSMKEQSMKLEKTLANLKPTADTATTEQKNPEKEKLTQIQTEICEYAKEVQKKVEAVAEKTKTSLAEPQEVLKMLTEISEYLLKNQSNQSEFGIDAFKNYVELIKEHSKVTIYELRRSKFIQNLLNFIFENTIESKSTQATMASSPQKNVGEEEKLNFPKEKDSPTKFVETRSKPNIEISEEQSRIILGRIVAFLAAFKTKSPRDPSSNILGNLVNNLQEMLINTDKLSTDQTGTQTNSDLNLLTDLRTLSMRVKFRAHWIQDEFSLGPLPDKKKTVSSPSPSQTNNPFKELQAELYGFKEDILKEIPSLVLSVEQFGTLEVIEDYILNRLNSKEDLLAFGGGGRMPHKSTALHCVLSNRNLLNLTESQKSRPEDNFLDYIKEKMDSEALENDLEGEEEGGLEGNEVIEDTKPESADLFTKTSTIGGGLILNPGTDFNPSTSKVSKSNALPTGLPLQKSSSVKPSRSDSKSKGDKKKWLDKLTGKEMNFKKYLEIKFFINGVEIPKTKALFEIFYKYRPNCNLQQVPQDDAFTVDYRLCKKTQEYSSYGILLREQQRSVNSLCSDYKQVIQNLINKMKDLDLGVNDDNLTSVVQLLLFLNEVRYIDAQLTSKSSLFAPALIELSHKHGMEKCVEHYLESSLKSGLLPGELMLANKDLENLKLSSLLDKTVSDPIVLAAGLIPSPLRGIALQTNFLLELNSRMKFYKLGCSPVTRALYYIYQANRHKLKELESSRIGKLRKKKIKVTREKILENAVVNMESYGFKKSLLEFEFQDEEGTGLGPTLEYYTMIAEEFKNPVHNLWRKTDTNMLFPSPIDPFDLRYPDPSKPKRRQPAPDKKRDFEKFQLLFRCLGTLTARAILDERVVDLPFHPIFWDLVLDRPVYLEDIARIDKQLGESLIALQAVVNKKLEIEKDPNLSPQEKSARIQDLKFKGCSIDDLALNFTFPGYEEIDLIENGEDMPVTLSNLDQYVSILTQYYLVETNKSQILAFRDGFDKVFPLRYLQALRSDEIEYLVCGVRVHEDWDLQTLQENILPSHGFSKNSPAYQNFIKVLLEFNDEQKRLFFKFTTGSERLPLGGLKLLNPKMTVVKKPPSDPSRSPDEYLPSVMTCQNYIKLPDYSSISVMRERIHIALKEGQASFSLS